MKWINEASVGLGKRTKQTFKSMSEGRNKKKTVHYQGESNCKLIIDSPNFTLTEGPRREGMSRLYLDCSNVSKPAVKLHYRLERCLWGKLDKRQGLSLCIIIYNCT